MDIGALVFNYVDGNYMILKISFTSSSLRI